MDHPPDHLEDSGDLHNEDADHLEDSEGLNNEDTDWVGIWGGARSAMDSLFIPSSGKDRSFRAVVSPTLGGRVIRVRFSNRHGYDPLIIGSASVALSKVTEGSSGEIDFSAAEIQAGTNTAISFGGSPYITIEPSEDRISDPIELPFSFGDTLAVSFYVKGSVEYPTVTRNCLGVFASPSKSGDTTDDETGLTFTNDVTSHIGGGTGCIFLNAIDLYHPDNQGTVVVLGDSITEGTGSDQDGPFDRWPYLLAKRINAVNRVLGVLNMGIAGNTVIHPPESQANNALLILTGPLRFQRDVLQQTHVRTVIIFLGGNDLRGGFADIDDITAGIQDMIDQGHEAGLRVLVATQPPGSNAESDQHMDEHRRTMNEWIRNHKGIEGWLPFDEFLRDPKNVNLLRAEYNGDGKNIHPGDAGKHAIANAVLLDFL